MGRRTRKRRRSALRLEEIAKKYSNDLFKIEIAEENMSIKHMDERDLVLEREYMNRN